MSDCNCEDCQDRRERIYQRRVAAMSEGKQETRDNEAEQWLSMLHQMDVAGFVGCYGERAALRKHLEERIAARQANQPQEALELIRSMTFDKCPYCLGSSRNRHNPTCPVEAVLSGQPQEKAQPESGEVKQFLADVEYIHAAHIEGGISVACRDVFERREQAAFQRGQQAMAEKAAQHSWFYYSVEKGEWVCGGCQTGLGDYTKSGEQRRKLIEAHIRSLASVEPQPNPLTGIPAWDDESPRTHTGNYLGLPRSTYPAAEPPQGEAEKEGRT